MDEKNKNNKFDLNSFIFNLIIAEGGGLLSSFLSGDIAEKYNNFIRPKFSAPGFIFPIAWIILYFLMALANTLVINNKKANSLYFIQLLINFLWPIFFFGLDLKFFSFVWLLLLLIIVLITTREFFKDNFISGALMLIYILWLIYAGYLNFFVWLLNK